MTAWKEAMWFSWAAGAALKTTAIWGAAWMTAKLSGRRSAAWRHTVWIAAAAATLAVPFLAAGLPALRVPVSLPELSFRTTATGAAPAAAATNLPGSHATTALPVPAPWGPIDWRLGLLLLWVAGTAAGVTQMALAGAAMARARKIAQPYPQPDETARLAEILDLDDAVPVLEAKAGTMPMVFGALRPAVFLPADAAKWPDERLRMVLLHELAHVKRGDAVTHLLARTALCCYWWNPMAWMAWREFLKERERATDDLVLAAGARASDYAGHLLEVARAMQPAPPMAWAAICMARPSQLEGRLVAILSSQVNRKAMKPVWSAVTALAAILAVAPLAAIRAQQEGTVPGAGDLRFRTASPAATGGADQRGTAMPADVEATIRAAMAQKNYRMLEQAASGFERLKDYGMAQRLLETALSIREEASGTGSAEYGRGLVKLGDLARQQKLAEEAVSMYTRAATALNGKAEAAQPLFGLGLIRYTQKNYADALGYFQQMQAADPAQSGRAVLWMALTRQASGETAEAELMFRRAMAETHATPYEASAVSLFKQFLEILGRSDEAASLSLPRVEAHAKPGAGAYRVGSGGVTAPKLISKQEPEYSEEARAAKYQGTAVLYVEIGPDGIAHDLQIVRGVGMGLDEKAEEAIAHWRFQPGTKDGVPVNVAATIEVNFRLM